MTSYLRPDEKAMHAEIERSQRNDQKIKSGINTAIGLGIGGAGLAGAKIGSKIMPFLNEYIPYDLALKGINKVSPALGGFLKKGMEKGLNLKDGLEFIKENISGKEEEPTRAQEHRNVIEQYSPLEKVERPKTNRNIIEQYDPELYTYLQQNIKKGIPVFEAGKQALTHSRFKKAIDKMTKDHKAPWASILQTVFGQEQGSPQQQTQQPEQMQQPQQQQGQPGQGAQALMAILQKINQKQGQ